jgi:hypothetical protein
MYESQPESQLLRQAYEIRLAVYSHIDLPPFDGHAAYAGLFLACRQLKHETEHEAKLQFNAFLEKMERRIGVEHETLRQDWQHTDAGGGGKIEITRPESAFSYPEVTVHIPFLIPCPEDEWHHFYCPQRRCRYSPAVPVRYDHKDQEWHYKVTVDALLIPLEDLFERTHFSRVNIHLTLPEESSKHTSSDTHARGVK